MRVARAKTKKVRTTVGSETRVIAVRTAQVQAVRDALLVSSHKLSRARAGERASLASVRETKRAFIAEAEGLQQTSSQLAARIQAVQSSSSSARRRPATRRRPRTG